MITSEYTSQKCEYQISYLLQRSGFPCKSGIVEDPGRALGGGTGLGWLTGSCWSLGEDGLEQGKSGDP